jgi:DNA-binding GntR family transcriptional regulator
LSATGDAAAERYREGVAAMVAGAAHAEEVLRAALAADGHLFLAQVALAAARAARGEPYVPPPVPGVTRGERQHAEVVEAMFCGDPAHAADLRREHLVEFPGDLLVVWLPVLAGGVPPPVRPTAPAPGRAPLG